MNSIDNSMKSKNNEKNRYFIGHKTEIKLSLEEK